MDSTVNWNEAAARFEEALHRLERAHEARIRAASRAATARAQVAASAEAAHAAALTRTREEAQATLSEAREERVEQQALNDAALAEVDKALNALRDAVGPDALEGERR